MTPIAGGCGVREHWIADDFDGVSLNMYDPVSEVWTQIWMDETRRPWSCIFREDGTARPWCSRAPTPIDPPNTRIAGVSLMSRTVTAALLFLSCLGSFNTLRAQDQISPQQILDARNHAYEQLGTRGYLDAVMSLLELEERAIESDVLRSFYYDILATQMSFIGEERRAVQLSDTAYPEHARELDLDRARMLIEDHRPIPAIDAIIEMAQNHRIVMINEEHRSSLQRAFANQLLKPLREIGFTHLAIETLGEDAELLHDRGYPVLSSGTYLHDPALGDLVRRALALGFTLVPYEADPTVMTPQESDKTPLDAENRRERAQAENIFERTLNKDPNSRVLVYAGRDHLAEYGGEDWIPMGRVLKEISGTDPLTINQYAMVERSKREFESWEFRAVEREGWLDGPPIVLKSKTGVVWSSDPRAIDMNVFHPRTVLQLGRPVWMSMGGLRQPYMFISPLSGEPILVQAVVVGESDDAIPLDQTVLWPGESTAALFLRDGEYRVMMFNRAGKELSSKHVTIK